MQSEGVALAIFLTKAGLTQKGLADMLGYSKDYISRLTKQKELPQEFKARFEDALKAGPDLWKGGDALGIDRLEKVARPKVEKEKSEASDGVIEKMDAVLLEMRTEMARLGEKLDQNEADRIWKDKYIALLEKLNGVARASEES
jgi:transcriptional regulator with XRE-family HTH domain